VHTLMETRATLALKKPISLTTTARHSTRQSPAAAAAVA
jgi:hypothetical protein